MVAHVDFDASGDYCRVSIGDGRRDEGIVLDSRTTSGGHVWSTADWEARIQLHLRMAANIADIIGGYVRYNQVWCEALARKTGTYRPIPEHMTERGEQKAKKVLARVIEDAMRAVGTPEFHARFGAEDAAPLVIETLDDIRAAR